jgi:uncharacterized protein (UPF0333 family)
MSKHEATAQLQQLIRKLRRSDGQAIVEFVLVLPLIVTLVFVIVQLGITFNNYLQVTDAARVGARAAAVARLNGQNACDAAQTAVGNVVNLNNNTFKVNCSFPNQSGNPGDPVSITVTDPWDVELPLIGISTGQHLLAGTSTEALE